MRILPFASALALSTLVAACGSDTAAETDDNTPDTAIDEDATTGGADGGTAADSGTTPDTGTGSDAGTATDTGETTDTGASTDTGGTTDTGTTTDTGASTDTGTTTDVDPYESGPATFGTQTVEVPLSDGGTINAYLMLPEGDGPWPGAIITPGFQLSGDDFVSYGEHLASYGYIVLVPTFGDTLLSPRTHSQLANDTIAQIDWMEAQNSAGLLSGRLDTSRIVAGGHSRGGKQSLLAAHRDDRIIASFNFDPVDAAPPTGGTDEDFPSVAPELMPDVTIPTGYIGAGLGAEPGPIPIGPACAPEEENYEQYFSSAGGPAIQWLYGDAGHNDFTDTGGGLAGFACPSGSDAAAVRSFSRATMVAFYKVFVEGNSAYEPWLDGGEIPAGVTVATRNY